MRAVPLESLIKMGQVSLAWVGAGLRSTPDTAGAHVFLVVLG